jgi:hypothetical protein
MSVQKLLFLYHHHVCGMDVIGCGVCSLTDATQWGNSALTVPDRFIVALTCNMYRLVRLKRPLTLWAIGSWRDVGW